MRSHHLKRRKFHSTPYWISEPTHRNTPRVWLIHSESRLFPRQPGSSLLSRFFKNLERILTLENTTATGEIFITRVEIASEKNFSPPLWPSGRRAGGRAAAPAETRPPATVNEMCQRGARGVSPLQTAAAHCCQAVGLLFLGGAR